MFRNEEMSEQEQDYRPTRSFISDNSDKMASIANLLKNSVELIPKLRRDFRGEVLIQYPDGTSDFVQMSKPVFIRMRKMGNTPIKKLIKYRDYDGNQYEKEIFVPNDEAIEEILSMLRFMGINEITSLSTLRESDIIEDLKEFECKLAVLLASKQKEWGIDKELLPMVQTKIKTLIQDARYMAKDGNTIKAIQKIVQRVEQSVEGGKNTSLY